MSEQVQVPQGHILPSAPDWSPQPLVPLAGSIPWT
jgi:hypothetical protein